MIYGYVIPINPVRCSLKYLTKISFRMDSKRSLRVILIISHDYSLSNYGMKTGFNSRLTTGSKII